MHRRRKCSRRAIGLPHHTGHECRVRRIGMVAVRPDAPWQAPSVRQVRYRFPLVPSLSSHYSGPKTDRADGPSPWRQYENLDNLLHRQIAQASRNNVLLGLFDVLNAVRRTVVWGRLRTDSARPPTDHHSFADHERIVAAISERDLSGAAAAMRRHLQQVERRLIPAREAAE